MVQRARSAKKTLATKAAAMRQQVLGRNIRDSVLFVGGFLGVLHEAILTKLDRPTLLTIFAAMMGLPAFLRTDERRNTKEPKAGSE